MSGRQQLIVGGAFVAGLILAFVLPDSLIFDRPARGSAARAGDSETRWACPMFCVVMEEKPADARCPVCGMELGPVSSGSRLSRDERTMIGLEVESLQEIELEKELLLYGEVEWDETRLSVVSARTAGWIEKLTRKITWAEVEQGDVLYELYAPEVFEAQQELLAAKNSPDLLAAARQRLSLLGLDDREVDAITKSTKPGRTVARRAAQAGVIVRRAATQGAYVARGAEVFAIADLARVWVQLEVFEPDLQWLAPGTRVALRDQSFGQESFAGVIVFADPVVDRMTRTARVRIEVGNRRRPDGRWVLLPGQRLEATARIPVTAVGGPAVGGTKAAPRLALPRTSVMRTGKRAVVYVLYDEGRKDPYQLDPAHLPGSIGYALVQVELGPLVQRANAGALDEYYPLVRIIPGKDPSAPKMLTPGMVVATNASFLLDSQAQLAGKPSLLFPDGRATPAATEHGNH